jgi:hypothetical protein
MRAEKSSRLAELHPRRKRRVAAHAVDGATGAGRRTLDAAFRFREGLMWASLFAATLNFTPSLFSTESVGEAPVWTKIIKDVPTALLAIAGVAVVAAHLADRPRQRTLWASIPGGRPTVAWKLSLCALIALAAFMATSAAFVAAPSFGYFVSARYYLFYPFLALVLWLVPFDRRTLDRYVTGIVFLALLQLPICIADFAGAFGNTFYAGHVEIGGYLFPRAIGTLGNPNNLGIFLGFGVLVAVFMLDRWSRATRTAVAVALFVGMVLTFSKTVFVALGLVSIGLAVCLPVRNRLRALSAVVLGTGVVAAVVLSSRTGEALSVESVLGSRTGTASNAFDRWTANTQSFFVGEGFGTVTDLDASGPIRETVVDNMVLALALEGGILGIVLTSAVVVAVVGSLFLYAGGTRLAVTAKAFAAFFLLYAPVAVNLRLFPGALFLWLFAGIALAHVRAERHNGEGPRRKRAGGVTGGPKLAPTSPDA